eukprot:TRINITY_DN4963_c0_g1_i1.p1 TRINITY_DN4963_c0_g1~~TRINITY_DN4963_c0_g1_i1.p1  ORF type:complete len:383 (+),score=60.97 TRINITY_DN4963_c0_g1_i1:67-1149(+)
MAATNRDFRSVDLTSEGDIEGVSLFNKETHLPRDRRFRVAGVTTAIIFLVAAGFVWFGAEDAGSDRLHAQRSVRSLLESKDFERVAVSNILTGAEPSDADLVNKYVAEGLANFTASAKASDPDFYKMLDKTFVSDEQWNGVLATVERMSDPRVQQMGREVALVVHEGKAEGPEGVKRRLVERFLSRTAELREMRDVYFPVHRSIGSNRLLDFSTEPALTQRRRLTGNADWQTMAARSGLSEDQLTVYASMFEKALAIIAGLTEQVRVALTQAQFLGSAFGKDTRIPRWATAMVGGLAFVTQLSDCVSQADDNKVKLYMCPMRYASALADLLTGFEDLFGGVQQSLEAPGSSGFEGFTWTR